MELSRQERLIWFVARTTAFGSDGEAGERLNAAPSYLPAEMATAPPPKSGARRDWPNGFSIPHSTTVPSFFSANVWQLFAAMSATSVRFVGGWLAPKSLLPQAITVPSFFTAKLRSKLAAMAT